MRKNTILQRSKYRTWFPSVENVSWAILSARVEMKENRFVAKKYFAKIIRCLCRSFSFLKSCISPLAEMGKLAAGRNRNLNFLDEQRTKEMFWTVFKNSLET